jgi:hypothetical protein
MAKTQRAELAWVVVLDGWVPEKYFSEGELEEAEKYARVCNYNYQGSYTVKACDPSHPRRFLRAVTTPAP